MILSESFFELIFFHIMRRISVECKVINLALAILIYV